MSRFPRTVRVAILLAAGAWGVWSHDPFIAVGGFGFAASELVFGRRPEAVQSLMDIVVVAVVVAIVIRGPFDIATPIVVVVGAALAALAVSDLWSRLRGRNAELAEPAQPLVPGDGGVRGGRGRQDEEARRL